MEAKLEESPTCMSLGEQGLILLGSVDGSLRLNKIVEDGQSMSEGWQFNLKASVRDVCFDHDGSQLFCVSRNRAVCSFDVETGKRMRCIVRGTDKRPNTLCLLPQSARKHQQFATGDEDGEIRTWDFRSAKPMISQWKEQSGDINAMAMDSRHNLLCASSDGTLAAYEVRKCKLRMKSEMMHSELLSLCVTDKYVYAGGGDGFIEVFSHGEYGNLLERIESGFEMGVNQIVELRKGLLITTSETSSKLRLLNVMPTKRLGAVAVHGDHEEGVDRIAVSPDKQFLVSLAGMATSVKIWPLAEVISDIPILRADSIKKRKQIVREGFFDDLVSEGKKKKKKVQEENEEDEDADEGEEEGDSDEEEEEDSDEGDDSDEESEEDSDDE